VTTSVFIWRELHFQPAWCAKRGIVPKQLFCICVCWPKPALLQLILRTLCAARTLVLGLAVPSKRNGNNLTPSCIALRQFDFAKLVLTHPVTGEEKSGSRLVFCRRDLVRVAFIQRGGRRSLVIF